MNKTHFVYARMEFDSPLTPEKWASVEDRLPLGHLLPGDEARLIAAASEMRALIAELAGGAVAAVESFDGALCGICEHVIETDEEGRVSGHDDDCLILRAQGLLARIDGDDTGGTTPCPACHGTGVKMDANGIYDDDVCPACDGGGR